MKIVPLSSGSSGNAIYIEEKNTKILVDAGHSGKKIEELLRSIGVMASELDAIFVTHEHIDHVKGVGVLQRRYHMDVFATETTQKMMAPCVKNLDPAHTFSFQNGLGFTYKDLFIDPMPIFHDSEEGSSFVISSDRKKVSILTDTGWVNTDMMEKMEGSNIFYLEANHDVDMLMNGYYTWPTKMRILSNRGHLSNENAAEVLTKLLKKKNEKVILAHLSKDNNLPSLALKTIEDILNSNMILRDVDFSMEVARRDTVTGIFEVEND